MVKDPIGGQGNASVTRVVKRLKEDESAREWKKNLTASLTFLAPLMLIPMANN